MIFRRVVVIFMNSMRKTISQQVVIIEDMPYGLCRSVKRILAVRDRIFGMAWCGRPFLMAGAGNPASLGK